MGTPVFSMVEGAALAVAPYSHFVEVDGWVFLTGQFGMTPGNDSAPIPDNIEDETHRTMQNLGIVLEAAGLGFEHVVSARVFLVNFERGYAPANAVYETYFAPGRRPARTCVGVTALARGGHGRDRFHRPPALKHPRKSPERGPGLQRLGCPIPPSVARRRAGPAK